MQSYRATKNAWVPVEHSLPKAIADHNDWRSPHLVLVFIENATNFRGNANYAEKISRHRSARNALRVTVPDATKVARFLVGSGQMFKNGGVVSPIEIIRQGNGVILAWSR